MTEAELQQAATQALEVGGWVWQHQRPGRTAASWATAIEGWRGFPDVIAVRDGRLLVLEFKSAKGVLSTWQARWLDELQLAGVDARVVRPDDLDALIAEVTGGLVA